MLTRTFIIKMISFSGLNLTDVVWTLYLFTIDHGNFYFLMFCIDTACV